MENIEHKIRRLIRYYDRMMGTRDPVSIARQLNIGIAIVPLGEIAGNYKLLKRKRWIFVNEDIADSQLFRVVVAHELGHAVLHRKENCAFIKHKTLLLTSGIEREANQFAAYLLISDDMLEEYAGCTEEQFCNCTGYPKELIELRLKQPMAF
ncbi:Zn peptidase [Lachnoclostridium sp. An14]|uniref:ImmA/IrrE family metallo-endopeptidase n=1 Tax=Lachnoclostridium sp. An14 TaxID=1965562 RepID=UPI000B3947F7|nr:ImmA/IrrE family metallo-endopeptidase [Lachnoclostridium sp. An14]OUQ17642.1 Zn peptidase [Lachnoclostridium sp. An14]